MSRPASNPWGSKSIEWQLPSPVPVHNFDRIPTFGSDPYPYGDDARLSAAAAGRRAGEADAMSELASHSTDYSVVEREPPEVMGRNLRVASQLWASATVFFFFAFLFAYFYLRSLELAGPVASAQRQGAGRMGDGDHRLRRRVARSRPAMPCAACTTTTRTPGAGWAWRRSRSGSLRSCSRSSSGRRIGFGPTDGGFASVFLGWTGLYILFVFGTLYWLETLLATSFRYRGRGAAGHEPGEASGDAERTGDDIEQPLSLIGPGARAFAFYWAVLAGIGVVTWFILYLL